MTPEQIERLEKLAAEYESARKDGASLPGNDADESAHFAQIASDLRLAISCLKGEPRRYVIRGRGAAITLPDGEVVRLESGADSFTIETSPTPSEGTLDGSSPESQASEDKQELGQSGDESAVEGTAAFDPDSQHSAGKGRP